MSNIKYEKLLLNEAEIDIFHVLNLLLDNSNSFMSQKISTPKGNSFIGMFGKYIVNVYWENNTNVLYIKFMDILGCDTDFIDDKYDMIELLTNEFKDKCNTVILSNNDGIQCSFFKKIKQG